VGALRVAVAGSVFGTSLVAAVFRQTTISVHFYKVDSTVKTAAKVGNINVKSELLVLELEHLVGRVAGHEVDMGADIGARLELEREGIARGGDTVRSRVISTLESTVCGAGDIVRAECSVPGVTGVAVGVAAGAVGLAPVRVEHNGTSLGRATRSRALRPAQGQVGFRLVGTDLLRIDNRNEREKGSESGRELHGECKRTVLEFTKRLGR
jgi:hypothetical protein